MQGNATYQRAWKDVQSSKLQRPSYSLNVSSYNILAHCYTPHKNNPKAEKYARFFPGISEEAAQFDQFEERGGRVIAEIAGEGGQDQKADIICLQEVDQYEEFYGPKLSELGYECILNYREPDAALVGWDKNKFKLISKKDINYNDIITCPKYEKFSPSLSQSDNVAVIALLQNLETKSHVLAVSTHLFFNPNFDHQKFAQTYWLLLSLQQMIAENDLSLDVEGKNPTALFIGGDFNSGPNSTGCHMMHNEVLRDPESYGTLDSDVQKVYEEDPKKKDFVNFIQEELKNDKPLENIQGQIQSSYIHYNKDSEQGQNKNFAQSMVDCHPLFTNYSSHFHGCFDFIYFSPSTAKVTQLLEVPSEEIIASDPHQFLPSSKFPSDHIRVQSKFEVYY